MNRERWTDEMASVSRSTVGVMVSYTIAMTEARRQPVGEKADVLRAIVTSELEEMLQKLPDQAWSAVWTMVDIESALGWFALVRALTPGDRELPNMEDVRQAWQGICSAVEEESVRRAGEESQHAENPESQHA